MEDSRAAKKQPNEHELVMDVQYSQYYLVDPSGDNDLALGNELSDGILGPHGTGVHIYCGTNWGSHLKITFRIASTLDGLHRGPGVAAECDLLLPGGTVILTDPDGMDVLYEHSFGHPKRCRILVQVSGRDKARYDFDDRVFEHHIITLAPTSVDQPRWRSVTIDEVGRETACVTTHVEIP